MPYNVRVVSVRLPEVDSNNQVLLDMVVGAKDVPPNSLDLFRRLEGSPQFGNTSVQSSAPPSQTVSVLSLSLHGDLCSKALTPGRLTIRAR